MEPKASTSRPSTSQSPSHLKAKHKVIKKQHWEPPLVGFYTINVDGAIPSTNGQSGVGLLIRDWNRRVIAAVSMSLPGGYSVEETEAIAVEQGLVLAKELDLEKIIVEGDSLLTIQAVETMDVRGVAAHIIKGIVQTCSSFQEAKVRHIDRNSNKIAHELAQHAKKSREKAVWRSEIPGFCLICLN